MNKRQRLQRIKKIRAAQKAITMSKKQLNIGQIVTEIKDTIIPSWFKSEEKKPKRFAEAIEVPLFEPSHPEYLQWEDWKGIRDKYNEEIRHNIVGKNYNLIQHDEAFNKLLDTLDKRELQYNYKVYEMDQGGRIHVVYTFDDINVTLPNGDKLSLRITLDNSYNGKTGLRMIVSAQNTKGFYLSLDKAYGSYYHKHTRGLDLVDLGRNVDKGVAAYEDKEIYKVFEDMLNSQLTLDKVLNMLDKNVKNKKISKTLKGMVEQKLNQMTAQDLNQYSLYCLMAEVIQAQVDSIDQQKRYLDDMLTKIRKI